MTKTILVAIWRRKARPVRYMCRVRRCIATRLSALFAPPTYETKRLSTNQRVACVPLANRG